VTIAQTCCKKEKTLDLLGLGCFSHGWEKLGDHCPRLLQQKRKLRPYWTCVSLTNKKNSATIVQTCSNKKKPKPSWTWMFIMWMKKIGQPSPKLALIERKTWAFLDLGVSVMNKKSRMTITWACCNNEKKT
jgi:hypothetical protein